jgi:hypothetical protein
LAGDREFPDTLLQTRPPGRPPGFSTYGSSFLPPGHQALQYMHGLLKEERQLRDMHELGSPEWFHHHRNVGHFENFPAELSKHPGFDVKREHRELETGKAANREYNQAVRARQKELVGKVEKTQDRLFELVELRWAAENHGKMTGKPVWGVLDRVPGLDCGDGRRVKPFIDIRGHTQVGVEREIVAIQQELNRLDQERLAPANLERTTPLFPKLEFRSRDEILEQAFGKTL